MTMSDEEILLKELYSRLKKKEEMIEWLTPRLEKIKAEAEVIRQCIALFTGEERQRRVIGGQHRQEWEKLK